MIMRILLPYPIMNFFCPPRNTPEQKVLESTITLAPAPSVFSRHEDFFGNSVIATTVDKPHKNLQITTLSPGLSEPDT